MTEAEDKLDQTRWEFWRNKAQQADSFNRSLNIKLYSAAQAARKKDANPLQIASTLGKPVEDLIREIMADGWDEGYAQGKEDERNALESGMTEYPTANRRNPYRVARTKGS